MDFNINGRTVRVYTSLEAAEYANVSEGTIGRWRREGYLLGQSFGRGFLYSIESIQSAMRLKGYSTQELEGGITNDSGR